MVFRFRSTGHRHRSHRHTELELNLVLCGRAVYVIDGRRYDVERGTLVWLFPRQEHFLLSQSPDFSMWVVVWHTSLVRRVCTADVSRPLRAQMPKFDFCGRVGATRTARLQKLMQETQTAQDAADNGRLNVLLGHVLLAAWDEYGARREIPPGRLLHPAVARVVGLLQETNAALPMGEMARQAGLSAQRLNRVFRAETGVSLVAYRNRQRLRCFLELCGGATRPKLLDAALAAGFGSYAQFHRVFTHEMGCGPRRYDFAF